MPMLFLRALCLCLLAFAAHADDGFLPIEQAFPSTAQLADAHTVRLRLAVAPGYHLYRERLAVTAEPAEVQLGTPQWPAGHQIHDPGLDRNMEVYAETIEVLVPVPGAPRDFRLVLNSQGCADAGLCYPPQTKSWPVKAGRDGLLSIGDDTPPPPPAATDETGLMQRTLQGGRLWQIVGLFLLGGLLLSFTPCVLPMVPILSSIIVGQQQPVSRSRGLSLSLAYALGMALVYTVFGIAAGLAGEGLAARLQQPAVLGAFALLLAALALSMFGLYDLQLPNAWQSRLSSACGRMSSGRHAGVFAMGGLSALIVGPCVAAPLAGALVFISQTRDVVIGALALFSLACGMSVPLLLVGLSAGSLLPRAGAWMEQVKRCFGVLLLGVAWWMVRPVLPAPLELAVIATALLAAAAWLWSPASRARSAASLLLGLVGAAELTGALAGSVQPLMPLAVLARPMSAPIAAQADNAFRRVRSLAELEAALRDTTTPTLLDVYADWCVACKEMEQQTFADPAVQAELRKYQRLQVDVTANNDDDRALLKRFGLFGPPGIVFFDRTGREQPLARVVGFQPATPFSQRLRELAGG